jgi:hypothetical protein
MPLSKPDFVKIFAADRGSIPEILTADYEAGWDAYLGASPPLADDHDYVMNLQDLRAVWLQEQLPSTGTTEFVRTLLDDTDAATARATLGIRTGQTAQQTITSTRLYTFTHGLGARPKQVQMWLVCLIADGGFTVGDVVPCAIQVATDVGGTAHGHTTKVNTTQFVLSIDTNHGMALHEWANTSNFALANGSWAVYYTWAE